MDHSKANSRIDRYAESRNAALHVPARMRRRGDPEQLLELAEAGKLRVGDDLYAAPSGGVE